MRQGEFNLYYNLTNSTVTKQILHSNYLDSKNVKLESLVITNLDSTNNITIDIYMYRLKNMRQKSRVGNSKLNTDGEPLSFDTPADVTESFYIIKNVVVPAGVSLKLEENELRFNNKKYALWVNKTGNYYVDLALNIIKR